MRIQDLSSFNAVREAGLGKLLPYKPRVGVGMGTCGTGNGAEGVYHAFADEIERRGLDMGLARLGCFGFCAAEPLVNVWLPGRPLVILHRVQPNDVPHILDDLYLGKITTDLAMCKIEEWDHLTGQVKYGTGFPEIPFWRDVPFFRGQKKIVLRNCGLISADEIEEYIAVGGYQALYKVLIDNTPDMVIEQIKASKLRGRGGAGYPTGLKWEVLRKAKTDRKYLICNADEGDPGAYMNRNEIESDPHSLLEGMIIGGFVTGAQEGIIYVRAEYPLAVHRLDARRRAGERVRPAGREHSGTGFQLLDPVGGGRGGVRVRRGNGADRLARRPGGTAPAAAAVPGAKRSLRLPDHTSTTSRPGTTSRPSWPRVRPGSPRPAATKSAGTKVFSLVGKVTNTGLVEMPLGTPLKTFVYDVGEGGTNGKHIKSVQTGGPSGGCIPQEMFDTPVDYETLAQAGLHHGLGRHGGDG